MIILTFYAASLLTKIARYFSCKSTCESVTIDYDSNDYFKPVVFLSEFNSVYFVIRGLHVKVEFPLWKNGTYQ